MIEVELVSFDPSSAVDPNVDAFLLSPSVLVRSLAAFGEREVGRLQCWQGFFNGVVVGVSGGRGLRLG